MKHEVVNNLIRKSEKLRDFELLNLPSNEDSKESKPFRFFSSAECLPGKPIAYRRRDYFKMSLLRGQYIVHYGDESIKANGCSLSFFSPWVPYTIQTVNEEENSGYLIFTELYYDSYFQQGIRNFPLFNKDAKPIFLVDPVQEGVIKEIFSKIEHLESSNYPFKHDLIRNCLSDLMHYANGLQSDVERHHARSSKERLYFIFNELLDRQYPVDASNHKFLRTPSDFSECLNVHVNYLNKVIKEMTGKSTSEILNERLLRESIILLKHTNLNISEIAYTLEFKDVSHFNHFFRKHADATPSSFRI